MFTKVLDEALKELEPIKTGVDVFDNDTAAKPGAFTLITGTISAGKTCRSLMFSIRQALFEGKKVLYLVSQERRFDVQLMFLKIITYHYGDAICRKLYKLHMPDDAIEKLGEKPFDQSHVSTLSLVTDTLGKCGVNFVSFDHNDFSEIEHEIGKYDYDIVVIDSPYQLHPGQNDELSQQTFCTSLAKLKIQQPIVATAPLSYIKLQEKSEVTLDDLATEPCGKILASRADSIIGLRVFVMEQSDDADRIVVLK